MALPFLDGSVIAAATSNAPLPVSLTTANTNDIIVVSVTADFPPSSVSSPTLGTFTHIVQGGSIPDLIDVWAAFSSGALTSETITVTPHPATGRIGVIAFGIAGTNQTSLTGAYETPVSGSYPLSITTTDPTTFVTAFTEPGSGVSFSPGAGWTQIQSDIRSFAQYQTVSPAATVTSTNNFGFGGANVNIAFIQASGGGGTAVPYNPWPQLGPIVAQKHRMVGWSPNFDPRRRWRKPQRLLTRYRSLIIPKPALLRA